MHTESPDLVLANGNVVTMDPKRRKVQAIAIKNGKFIAIGMNKDIIKLIDQETKKVDLKGKTVLPGFIDSHVHGTSLGNDLFRINLRGVKSIDAIQQKIKRNADATNEGQWIIGRGWDQDKLVEKRYPVCSDLDEVAPNHPVLLIRVCGHLGVVNSMAMRLAQIDKKTKSPQGGKIDKDPVSGQPNGILRENSLNLIFQTIPRSSEENLKELCLFACEQMVKEGITTAHWIIDSLDEMRVLQQLRNSESLPLRVNVIIPVNQLTALQKLGYAPRFGDERIRIGSVKIFTDGSLGARTAALLKPYHDAPGTKGILLYSHKKLGQLVEKVVEADLQLVIHAIGDRAIEVALKLLEETLRRTPKMNHRHRIEHVSVLNLKLLRKMKELGVIASVQPHFVVSDSWIEDRLGKGRSRWTYALRKLWNSGVKMIGGSDAPVEPVSPILGIYAAMADREFLKERLSIDEAISLYTINGAYGSFEENLKGSVEEGKLADIVVLSQDPYNVTPEKIKDIRVEMTIVNGEIVFTRPEQGTNSYLKD